jgi:pyruvate dehydrogenase E2 component (dihydrolipoamide acetyltransferase)
MADIVMPRLSDTMEEGTILRWLKHDGEHVARGEELAEIETDKATMTYESDQEGVLEIVAREGHTLEVGALIARVGAAGMHAEASPPVKAGGEAAADGETNGERVKASPLARRVARESGVDLSTISGSGPGGRIVKADVIGAGAPTQASGPPSPPTAAGTPGEAAQRAGAQGPATTPPALQDVMTAKGTTTDVELSRRQQTVARRMAEAKATIPDFALQIDVDMRACVTLRAQLKELAQPVGGESSGAETQRARGHDVPTYNDMVVKAAALALREHPHANGSYRDGRVQLFSRVNVGVAVASTGGEDGGALVVPTVFDADEKSLGEIARETRALAERVRSGAITPPELGGGTFTVSNLGMYGITSFTAIINPPQAGILSVGALAPRAVVHDGAVVARDTMTLTLACDHRILYGTEAALFLARVRELLETPAALTL